MSKVITVLSPQIKVAYDQDLLSYSFKLGDDLEKLNKVYLAIKKNAEKFKKYPQEYAKWNLLEKQYLDLYERTKTKEENKDSEAKNKTQEPFYYARILDKRSRDLFFRLRFAR